MRGGRSNKNRQAAKNETSSPSAKEWRTVSTTAAQKSKGSNQQRAGLKSEESIAKKVRRANVKSKREKQVRRATETRHARKPKTGVP
jgi:hypothetical protein